MLLLSGTLCAQQAASPAASAEPSRRSVTTILDRIGEAQAKSPILESVTPPPLRVDLDALAPELVLPAATPDAAPQRQWRLDARIARGLDGQPIAPRLLVGGADPPAGFALEVIPSKVELAFKDHPDFVDCRQAGDVKGNRYVVFDAVGDQGFELRLPSFACRFVLSARILGSKSDADLSGGNQPVVEVLADGASLGSVELMPELIDRAFDLPAKPGPCRITLRFSKVTTQKGHIAALRSFALEAADGRDRFRLQAPAAARGLVLEYRAAAPQAVQTIVEQLDRNKPPREFPLDVELLPGRVGVVATEAQEFEVLLAGQRVAATKGKAAELVFDTAEFGTRTLTLRGEKGLRGGFWLVQPRALYMRAHDPVESLRDPLPLVRGLEAEPGHALVRHVMLLGETRRSLLAPPGTEVSVPVRIEKGDVLEFAAGAAWLTEDPLPRGSVSYVIEVETPDGKRHPVTTETAPRRKKVRFEMRSAPIPEGCEGDARLVFTITAGGRSPFAASDWLIALGEPLLVHASGPRRPNLLIYLIDTLRADHCSPWGYARETTPNLAELASQGVLFERAYSQAPWTRPSVATLFTSYLHTFHNASKSTGLAPQLVTLAERMRGAGYETAGFIANAHVHGGSLNFEQGFSRFEAINKSKKYGDARAKEVDDAALEWLRTHHDRPFFLYVHTIDPHAPYDPPEETLGTWSEDYDGPISPKKTNARNLTHSSPLPPDDLQQVIDLYDEEILFGDRDFGRLCKEMKELGVWDDTILVVLSDHGEEFYEHEGFGHGNVLWQEVLQVPLIVKPDRREGDKTGHRSDERVRVLDLAPTLLKRLGVAAPESEFMGVDLSAAFAGGELPELAVIAEEWPDRRTLISGKLKWISYGAKDRRQRGWLFDLEQDPFERKDLSDSLPDVLKGMQREFERLIRDYEERGFQHVGGLQEHLDAVDVEALRHLGYIDDGEGAADGEPADDEGDDGN